MPRERERERERQRERERESVSFPVKSPNLRYCQDHSQNKGLSEYQRRVSRLDWPSPCQRQAGGGSRSQKRASSAPERHPLPNCKQAPLLTKTSWDSEQLTSARRVAARDQLVPQRRHMAHLSRCTRCHPENRVAGTGEPIRRSPHLGEDCMRQAPGHLSCLDLGRHKTQAQRSLRLCGVPENLNLSGLDLGSALNPRPTSGSSLAEQPGA